MTMGAMRAALSLSLAAVALSSFLIVEATSSVTREVVQQANHQAGPLLRKDAPPSNNFTEQLLKLQRGPSREEINEELKARKQRAKERSERAREKLKRSQPEGLHRMTKEEVDKLSEQDHPFMRRASWGNGGGSGSWGDFLEDPSQEYDKWQQAYRFLGGYIDCDHDMSQGSGSGDNNNNDGDGQTACSRWMIWAAYVDESYSGMEYYEYYGDNPVGVLDCHDPDTSWKLLGVYRQEFYQYIEQISKHLWAIDEYEYVTALGGLAYMTDYDCYDTGLQDSSGNEVYAGVQPLSGGQFQMALYTDGGYCLTPNENTGYSFSDLGRESNMKLESGDGEGDDGYNDDSYYQMQEWWEASQEPYLTNLNEVYQTFRYCYSCVDYPTYQDGYFIGDDGTDDDDLINQCWKFWSHDSYVCETDCLAKAHAQGTILAIHYNGQVFGSTPSSFYEGYSAHGNGASTGSETKMTRLMANVFVAFSFIVFVATFLAFAVARRSRQREKRSSKRRRLLDEDGKSRASRSSRRRRGVDGDGLYRSSRSKSADQRARSSSGRRSKSSSGKSRSKSVSRSSRHVSSGEEGGGYEPPRESHRRTSSRSRRPLDDF